MQRVIGVAGLAVSGADVFTLQWAARGEAATGQTLPSERNLKEMFQISRGTLREALRVLEQKGLVEIRKGHRGGIFVKEINADSMTESLGLFVQSQRITMEEISEFRQDLEGLLTRRAGQGGGGGLGHGRIMGGRSCRGVTPAGYWRAARRESACR